MIALLMLIQSFVGPPDDSATAAPSPQRQAHCAPADGDEITVCARDPNADRLGKLPPIERQAPVRAEVRKQVAPGATVSAAAKPVATKEGTFMRAMVGVDIAF